MPGKTLARMGAVLDSSVVPTGRDSFRMTGRWVSVHSVLLTGSGGKVPAAPSSGAYSLIAVYILYSALLELRAASHSSRSRP